MMNEGYTLPESICIDGTEYAVNTDFRVWIQIGETIQRNDINIFEKCENILRLCYCEKLPPTLKKSMEGDVEFYTCGKSEKNVSEKKDMPVVDFLEDAEMIAAAFYHDYRINLWSDNVHWRQFRELFAALDEKNKIVKVMGYRSVNLGDIKDKEQKKFYRKMKKLYRLKDKRGEEEKERYLAAQLSDIYEEV